MNETRVYSLFVPAAPPPLPEGYTLIAYRVMSQAGTHQRDEMDQWVGSGRFYKPETRRDWNIAMQTWVEHGVRSYDLMVEAECETVDEDGEGGAFSATCWWNIASGLDGEWTPWYDTGDMRSDAVTIQEMIERGFHPKARVQS